MRKTKRWEIRLALLLVFALGWNLCSPNIGISKAYSDDERVTDTGVSIPIGVPTTLDIDPADKGGYYYAYSFTTGSIKQYYHITFKENGLDIHPETYISKHPTTDRSEWACDGYFYLGEHQEIGDVLGKNSTFEPNTTYYILIRRDVKEAFHPTITIDAFTDKESDSYEGADSITVNEEKYASLEGEGDVDVFVFDTGDNTYSMVAQMDEKTTANKDLFTSINLTIYSDPECKNSVTSSHSILSEDYGSTYMVDLSKNLEKNTRYYFKVNCGTHFFKSLTFGYLIKMIPKETITPTDTWTVDPGRDGYTAAETNTDGYTVGKIDSTKDQDVLYFDTGDYVYSMDFYGDNQVYFEIYSDIDLRDFVYYVLVNSNTVHADLSKELKTNTRYYIRIISKEDEEVGPQGYEILTHKTQASSSSSTSTKKKKMNYTKYLKKYKYVTNRYSNVTGKIKGKKITFKKNKNGYICWMNFSNGNGGSRYLTNKSGEMKKKKYTYKIAKGCKVIYDADADGKKATIKSKKWFNKKFNKKWPQGSSWAEFGVFLNKKNKVVLIFSGDMLGAWQT